MQSADTHRQNAGHPPEIDELSSRLAALASRIDTLNGGRRPERRPRAAAPQPSAAVRVAPQASAPAAEPATENRQWPRLPFPGDRPPPDLPGQIAAQANSLREHERRIAELAAIRDRQAKELLDAREHIERQALALKSLRELTTDRDGEVAELTRRLAESESDKVALESQLATALRDANNWSVRLMANEGALSNKAADLSEANQLIDDLRGELAASQVAAEMHVAAAQHRLQRRHEAERSLHNDNTSRQLADLQALVAERDRYVAELEQDKAALCGEIETLAARLADCLTELATATGTLAAKDSHIAFLDTVIKVTRDNAEATLKELIAEFDREREEFAAKARANTAFQNDLVQLLPKLLERRAAA